MIKTSKFIGDSVWKNSANILHRNNCLTRSEVVDKNITLTPFAKHVAQLFFTFCSLFLLLISCSVWFSANQHILSLATPGHVTTFTLLHILQQRLKKRNRFQKTKTMSSCKLYNDQRRGIVPHITTNNPPSNILSLPNNRANSCRAIFPPFVSYFPCKFFRHTHEEGCYNKWGRRR